jgi:hypothetical protein
VSMSKMVCLVLISPWTFNLKKLMMNILKEKKKENIILGKIDK